MSYLYDELLHTAKIMDNDVTGLFEKKRKASAIRLKKRLRDIIKTCKEMRLSIMSLEATIKAERAVKNGK